jgi:hypothetical protein
MFSKKLSWLATLVAILIVGFLFGLTPAAAYNYYASRILLFK